MAPESIPVGTSGHREVRVSTRSLELVARTHISSRWVPRLWESNIEIADAVVFVADSQTVRRDANREWTDIVANVFHRTNRSPPVVLQCTKRDLVDIDAVEELTLLATRWSAPVFGSVAREHDVWQPFAEAAMLAARARGLDHQLRLLLAR